MANEIAEARKGLATALSNGIDGLRVFDYAPEKVHEFPAAIVRLESREPVETLGGGAMRGTLCVEALVSASDAREAEAALAAFIEPQGTRSIEAAASADRTWGGAVDDARLVSVGNIGRRKVGGVGCLGAEFRFWFLVSGQ